jgi:hypothetical protein
VRRADALLSFGFAMTVTDIPSGSDAVMFDTERLWCVCQSIGVDRPGFDLLVSLMDTGRAYVQPWLECDVVTWAAVAADAIAPLVDVSCLDKHTFHASRNVIVRALFDRWFVHGEQPSKHAAAALTPPTMSSVLGELDGILQVPDSLALAARMGTWMHRCARVESISLRGRGAWAFLDALHSNRDAYQTSAPHCFVMKACRDLSDWPWKRWKVCLICSSVRRRSTKRVNTHHSVSIGRRTAVRTEDIARLAPEKRTNRRDLHRRRREHYAGALQAGAFTDPVRGLRLCAAYIPSAFAWCR